MNSKTNNNSLKLGDEVPESDRCTHTVDEHDQGDRSPKTVHSTLNATNQSETCAPTPDVANASNNNQDVNIVQLMCMFEVQKTVIDELKLKVNQIEVELKVQKIDAAREIASVREKCEHLQQRSQVLEGVPPRNGQLTLDHSQTEWDKLFAENATLKKQNKEQHNEINRLKSIMAERLENLELELLTQLNDSKRDVTDGEDVDRLTYSAKRANRHEEADEFVGCSDTEAVSEPEYTEVVEPAVRSTSENRDAIALEVESLTCVSSSAKCHEEPVVIADVAERSVGAFYSGGGDNTAWMDNVSVGRYTSTEYVDNSPFLEENGDAVRLETTTDSNGNVPLLMANEDEPRLMYFSQYDELANRLRSSNNPAVQKLKYIDSVNQTTVHCYVEFLDEIADEEQLSLFYDTFSTPYQHDSETVELTISPLEGSVFGYGESLSDAQQEAAYVYLTRFKLMLKE